jgi:hypothetical protein
VFIRELVPRAAIAWLARARYNEPYRAVPMRHSISEQYPRREVSYEWDLGGRWNSLAAQTEGPAAPLQPGSEAEFITEHYWGYTRQRDGGTVEYQVTHPSWRVWVARDAELRGDMEATYGRGFAHALAVTPRSGFVAAGSAVTVFRPRRIDPRTIGA